MDMDFKARFMDRWTRYFDGSELPIVFYYTEKQGCAEVVAPPSAHQCIIGVLSKVRGGTCLCFAAESIGCAGGKRYLGFSTELFPGFEYFLSCGIPGKLEGERYKKSPEIVAELMRRMPVFKAPSRYIVFKRWDALEEADRPEVVVFFAKPDVLSGLFTLCGFEEVDPNAVFAPFCAGCASIVQYPFLEKDRERPRGVLGMFDVSARPFVPSDRLTFAVSMNKFEKMVGNMDESFLITGSWDKVRRRLGAGSREP